MALDLINLKFSTAKNILREGDVLLFRGRGLVSAFIRRAGEGCYTHVGVASRYCPKDCRLEDFIWECVEFREWKGGRSVNLERYVNANPGIIDVFRPSSSRNIIDLKSGLPIEQEIVFDGYKVTSIMRKMTGLPYGWRRIRWIAQHKIPFLRLFYSLESVVDDGNKQPIYPVCSSAVAYAFSQVNYDLTHHRADEYMEPSDVARSALLHYVFTLQAD